MNTKTCSKCNTENPQEANYCRHCGAKFEEKSLAQTRDRSLLKTGRQIEIECIIKQIIANKLDIDISKVIDSANFAMDLYADSLDTVELIMEVEKEFGISIRDEDTQRIATVGDLINLVCSEKSKL